MRIAILTISDAASRGERADTSGDAAADWADARLVARDVVPDESVEIVRRLTSWCDNDEADLIITTGGTGLSPRDITPEATRAVIERDVPGIAERIRYITGLKPAAEERVWSGEFVAPSIRKWGAPKPSPAVATAAVGSRGYDDQQHGSPFPRAALGRGISGTRGRTLIINLPGSTNGVRESLKAIDDIIDHAVAILRDERTDHSAGKA